MLHFTCVFLYPVLYNNHISNTERNPKQGETFSFLYRVSLEKHTSKVSDELAVNRVTHPEYKGALLMTIIHITGKI